MARYAQTLLEDHKSWYMNRLCQSQKIEMLLVGRLQALYMPYKHLSEETLELHSPDILLLPVRIVADSVANAVQFPSDLLVVNSERNHSIQFSEKQSGSARTNIQELFATRLKTMSTTTTKKPKVF